MHDLRAQLAKAIDEQRWDDAQQRAREINGLIPQCLSPAKCKTGEPHLDGLYAIGELRFSKAPKKVTRVILHMNRLITAYKRSRKKKPKKKKGT